MPCRSLAVFKDILPDRLHIVGAWGLTRTTSWCVLIDHRSSPTNNSDYPLFWPPFLLVVPLHTFVLVFFISNLLTLSNSLLIRLFLEHPVFWLFKCSPCLLLRDLFKPHQEANRCWTKEVFALRKACGYLFGEGWPCLFLIKNIRWVHPEIVKAWLY